MNLKDVLVQLNSRVVEQLFKGLAWQNGNPEEIAHRFIQEIPTLWGKLNPEERKVLVYFLFCTPGQSIPYRQMDGLAKSYTPYTIYRGLTGLRQKGITYTQRYKWGEMAFFIPEDVAYFFRNLIWESHALPNSVSPIVKEQKEFPLLCDILFQLLQTYRHNPISLTKKEELPTRVRHVWQELIPYSEELFLPLNYRKVEWFFSFLEEQGLMALYEKEGKKFFIVQEEQVAQLFQGNQGQVQKRLYEAIKRIYTHSHPFFTVIFEGIERNQWKTCWEQIVQHVGIEVQGSEWEEFSQQVFPLFQAFGCFQEVENLGEIKKVGFVQPTFEVLLLPGAPYEIRWALGNYARLIQQQELWGFQFDKETITQVQGGNRKEVLFTLLETIQQGTLPENVLYQITKWMEATEEVKLENVTLLRCSSKALGDRLACASVKGLEERINDTLFLVESSAFSLLQKELNKMEVQLKEKSDEEMIPLFQKQELLEENIQVESIYPILEDVLPEVKELPSLWRKNRQKYHASTLRIFMEKAFTLGLPIHMETRNQQWEGIYIRRILQEQGVDKVCFTDGVKDYTIPLMEIGPIQMKI